MFEIGQHVLCIDNECMEHLLDMNKVYTVKNISIEEYVMYKHLPFDKALMIRLEEAQNVSTVKGKKCYGRDIGFFHLRFKPLEKISMETFYTEGVLVEEDLVDV